MGDLLGGVIDDAELGVAGIADEVGAMFGVHDHEAAYVWAHQEAAKRTAAGTPTSWRTLYDQALAADAGGKVVDAAAKNTVNEVATKVHDAIDITGHLVTTILIVAGLVAALYVAGQL